MVRFEPDILPAAALARLNAGQRIGLLGGSFNPAHEAHRHISLIALRRLNLDAVLWLVSPQNPLKPLAGMATLEKRLARARAAANHPRIYVSAAEEALGTRYTVDTLDALTIRFSSAKLVWLMGGDSFAQFDRWRDWRAIAGLVPFAVVARPGFTEGLLASRAAIALAPSRVSDAAAGELALMAPPAWVFLQERLDAASATAIRAQGLWP